MHTVSRRAAMRPSPLVPQSAPRPSRTEPPPISNVQFGILATAPVAGPRLMALLPNHAHLLVRTGPRPLPRSMRSLLTGYAGTFNRRHPRVGHLFQNRYKPIVVEEEPYLLEVVRYLHLNPLRGQVVPDLRTLARQAFERAKRGDRIEIGPQPTGPVLPP